MRKQVGFGNRVLALVALASLVVGAAPAKAAQKDFTLLRAVPGDVFICVAARDTQENEFLAKYWSEVFEAARSSGVGDEFLGFISSLLGDSEKAEMDRLIAKGKSLIEAVKWSELASQEFVFAERLAPAVVAEGNSFRGAPDVLLLFRGDADAAPANFDGLVAVIEGILAEVPRGQGEPAPTLARSERHGARVAERPIVNLPDRGVAWGLTLAQREDVIAIVLGDKMVGQVLGLLAGEGDAKGLRETERFTTAMGRLPEPESSIVFFDMQALMGPIRNVAVAAAQHIGPTVSGIGQTGQNPEATQLHRQALQLATEGKYDEALELQKKAHELAPQDTLINYNLACFLARTGAKDEALTALEGAVAGGLSNQEMLRDDPDLESIREDARFQALLAKTGAENEKANPWPKIVDRLLSAVEILDYVASVEHTEGYSVYTDSIAALRPGAQENPIYPVLAGTGNLKDFARFLPAETMSYSACSGIDFSALYTYVLDTIRMAGPEGEEALQEWAKLQESGGVNVEKDILGWIEGPMTTVTLQGGIEKVFLVKVSDDARAKEKVGQFIQFISKAIAEHSAEQPMLAMFAIRTAPVQDERLEGFEFITIGMNPQPMVWGVAEGHLILGTSSNAVATCLATARGKHPNATTNEQFMAEALVPKGEFTSASLTDMRGLGQKIAGVLGALSMASGFVSMGLPEEARPAASKVAGMLMKLTPAVTRIDFFKSTSALTTFDGKAWTSKGVTHYFAPDERPSAAAAASATSGSGTAP
jgi:hypothetical protein